MAKMQKVVTPEFRVSFPNVFKPKAFENQEPKFSLVMLFPKKTDISKLKALAKAAVMAKWPDETKRPKDLRSPFRDGDAEKGDMDGYAGHVFISASSKMQPGVVDQNMDPIMTENDFYAGCYARASVTCYAYDRAGNRGVAFGLQNVQKVRDGEHFSGRSKPEDDFDVIEGGSGDGTSVDTADDMFS